MKITKRILRKIIQEEKFKILKEASYKDLMMDKPILDPVSRKNVSNFLKAMGMLEEDCDVSEPALEAIAASGEMPCPYKTAEMVRASGALPEEVMSWLGTFLSELSSEKNQAVIELPASAILELP